MEHIKTFWFRSDNYLRYRNVCASVLVSLTLLLEIQSAMLVFSTLLVNERPSAISPVHPPPFTLPVSKYSLYRFRNYKIAATPPQTRTPVKTTFRHWCFYISFVLLGFLYRWLDYCIFSARSVSQVTTTRPFLKVFRIHDILVWIRIRIRGPMPLTNGSGCGSGFCSFCY